ncbi:MAG: thiamine pyrophosphate-dependent enzyme [Eubacteriaceae bacterium]|jgi:2-oxoglutarate ferredoxin oxidoreductase subunit beta|nr:thiamine pyrophosphate-dependent enzyme [Eubacteriaceae bacterium]
MKYSIPKTITNIESGWCPGCGHGIVTRLLAETTEELGISDKVIIVRDVACGSMQSGVVTYNNIGAAHGRTIAVAAGAKRIRKEDIVIANPGDGSAYSIGIESTMHAALRNENILALVVNNSVFGMTGGQMSPTTLPGQKTTSSPYGRDTSYNGNLLDIMKVLNTFDIAYLARGSVDSPSAVMKAKKYIKKALMMQQDNKGFCLVEILSPCPTNWGLSPEDSLKFIKEKQQEYFPLGEYVDKGGYDK